MTMDSVEVDEDDFPQIHLVVRKVMSLPVPPRSGMEIGDDGVDEPLTVHSVIVREGYFVVRCKIRLPVDGFRGQKIALRGSKWQGADDDQSPS